MSRAGGEVEFEFLGDESEGGNFVATGKVVPMLTTLLAKGDVEGAMQLYEGCDTTVAAELLTQSKTMSSISLKNLGAMFVLARDFTSAATVFESGKRYADAAKMFEQGSDFIAAARCHERAGELPKAAAAFERAGKPDAALELYQKLGPSEELALCMARQHLYWEAAKVYAQLNNTKGEVENLRMVPMTSPNRIPAVKRLGDLMERHGHLGPAAQLLVETLQQLQAAQGDRELLTTLIRRFEAMGRHDHAERVRALSMKQLGPGAGTEAPGSLAPRPSPSAPPRLAPQPPPSAPAPVRASAATVMPADPFKAAAAPASSDPFASFVDPFGGGGASSGAAASSKAAPAAAPVPANDGYGQLKAIPIFGELALPDMKDLHRISEATIYAPGFTIIEQGVKGVGLVVILQGSVQVLRVDGGKTTPLATLSPGSYVGELSLVDDAPTSARVVAQEPVRALVISRERFSQYLYTHEAAATRIFMLFTRTLAERLRQANKRN